MAKIEALVNPALLAWAREDAGLPLEVAAAAVKVPKDTLASWESGAKRPPLGKAESLAKLYRRSLSIFYLEQPPDAPALSNDFRSGPGAPLNKTPQLQSWLRRIRERRQRAIEVAQALGMELACSVPQADLSEDPEVVAQRLLASLHLSPKKGSQSSTEKYKTWREALESVGVLVFQIPANAQLDASCISGFSLGEFPMPVVTVNRGVKYDSHRLFTLVHEYVHLMLRSNGICDLEDPFQLAPQFREVEVFCNAVAGAALVPTDELLTSVVYLQHPETDLYWHSWELKSIALEFGVSQEVVLRRLLKLGRTTAEHYRQWRARMIPPPEATDETESAEVRIPGHIQTLMSVGKPYARLILLGREHEVLNTADACFCLGAKLHQLPKLEESVF